MSAPSVDQGQGERAPATRSAERTPESSVRVRGAEVDSPRAALLSRPAAAAATVVALALAAELVPALAPLRLLRPPAPREEAQRAPAATPERVGEAKLEHETHNAPTLSGSEHAPRATGPASPIAGERASTPAVPPIELEKPPPVALEDASGHALDGFYAALVRTAHREPGAVTRITHLGDSIVVGDWVSGTLRRNLQREFGDAGHGFSLLANAWPGYSHNDVTRWASRGWRVSRVVGPLAADGFYGLGGVSFRGTSGAQARFATSKKGELGRAVSRFSIYYLEQPGGGVVRLAIDGQERPPLVTTADAVRSKVHELVVPDGEHELELTVESGELRAFGVAMERDVPGIVLDAVGVQGARIRFLDKQDDAHWAEQLKLRAPHLLIYQFGANESMDGFAYPMAEFLVTMKAVLAQGRRALPEAGCLVIGAMDRAVQHGDELTSASVTPALVKQQRRAAAEEGCAFFDTYQAMGGRGSMPSWVERGLGQADLVHPTGTGAEVLGRWIFRALAQGFNHYLATPR